MAQKRQTLGPLSQNSLNSRPSIGGTQTKQLLKRLTLGPPQTSSRSSSIGATPRRSSSIQGTFLKNDPRPLSDKNFVTHCIRSLVQYLSDHGYDHAISPKILTSPTGKDFTNILQFLLRQVDPKLKFGDKFLDEVPFMFKKLRYPFQISKTALCAVGSPHTWPALLAALTWLVELLRYQETVDHHTPSDLDIGVDDNNFEKKIWLDYIVKAYSLFMDEADDESHLEEELLSVFDQRVGVIMEEIKALQEKNTKLKRELEAIGSGPSPLAVLQQKKSDFLADIEKFKKLISNLHSHKRELLRKLEEKKQDLEAKENELKNSIQDRANLQERIEVQESNAVDLQRMTKEKMVLEENVAAITAVKDLAEKNMFQLEVNISKKLEEVEKALVTYRHLGDRLHLIPATAKHAQGKDLNIKLNLNALASRPDQLVNVDVRAAVKPWILQLKDSFGAKTRGKHETILSCKEKLDHFEETKAEKEEEIESLQSQLKKLEAQYSIEKEALGDQVRQMCVEAQTIEEETDRTRTQLNGQLLHNQRILESLNTEFESLQTKLAVERGLLNEKLIGAVQLLTNHKDYIQNTLDFVEKHFQAKYLELIQLRACIAQADSS